MRIYFIQGNGVISRIHNMGKNNFAKLVQQCDHETLKNAKSTLKNIFESRFSVYLPL